MRVVGLVSGGKDSVYNLIKCVAYGHEIVAIANLAPDDTSQDECDSHMFQTIGHGVVRDLAACMGVPFFSRRLSGSSVRTSLHYERTGGDEVEDMHALLVDVMKAVPRVEAVSSGAILSAYQRLRVEHVADRLGLTSLAFLWQKEQAALLDEMLTNGVRAVLLKVASMGLMPRLHLGRDLAALQAHLLHIGDVYGVNVCGEGGEYETLALDCPLFVRRLVLDDTEMVGDLRTNIAPVTVLRINQWHVEDKPGHQPVQACKQIQHTAICMGIDVEEEAAADALANAQLPQATEQESTDISAATASLPVRSFDPSTPVPSFPVANVVGDHCFIATASCANGISCAAGSSSTAAAAASSSSGADGAGDALRQCVSHVETALVGASFSLSDVVYVQLFLQSMTQFAAANAVYQSLFSMDNAPSRACVQLAEPAAAVGSPSAPVPSVSLDCVASRAPRDVLHVQSVSEWAPACIGPYSQATKVAPLVWLAGQIGLEPATMTLPPSARTQTALALRHCAQVLYAVGASVSRLVSAVIYWQAKFWREQQPLIRAVLLPLIEHRLRQSDGRTLALVHVAVPALPRDALVEVQLIGATSTHTQTAVATALIVHAPEAATQMQSPLLLRCPLHATLSPGAFASIWSAITVEHHTPASESDSAHPSLDPSAALSLLVRTVDASFASARLDWSHVLVCRLYLSPLLCERDVRIAFHRALAERGVARVPAVSFLHVQCVQLQAATSGADPARALLAAHIMLVADASSNQTTNSDDID